MNIRFLSFAVLACGLASMAFAGDSDPGYGNYGPKLQVRPGANDPLYFRPLQRYYGKGYTVAYDYIAVTRRNARASVSSFDTTPLQISSSQRSTWGVRDPRLMVVQKKSAAAAETTATTKSATSTTAANSTTTTTTTTKVQNGVPPVSSEQQKQ